MNQHQKNTVKELEEEIENIYVAWPYFFELEDSDLSPAIDTLSEFLSLKGKAQEGIKLLKKALTIVSQKARLNTKLVANLNWAIGWLFRDLGNLYQAKDYAETSLKASGLQHPFEQSRALRLLGAINRQLGDFTEAKNLFEAELDIYKRDNNLKAMSFTLNHLGFLYIQLGHYAQAEEMILESIAISRNIELYGSLVYSLQSLSTLFLVTNRFREAELTLLDNLTMAQEIECVPLIPFLLRDLGQARYRQGHLSEANQYLQDALSYALDPMNEPALVSVFTEFARINIDADELVQAETYLMQALSIGRKLRE